jgi:hypothetical protein
MRACPACNGSGLVIKTVYDNDLEQTSDIYEIIENRIYYLKEKQQTNEAMRLDEALHEIKKLMLNKNFDNL